jgi:hypothetical protein
LGKALLELRTALAWSSEPQEEEGERLLVWESPLDMELSSECLDGLIEADSRLSLAGLVEGGGILMLGRSMVVFVCSVAACTPFLRVDEALVADRRVCEVDLLGGRDCFADPELELDDMTLVRPASS